MTTDPEILRLSHQMREALDEARKARLVAAAARDDAPSAPVPNWRAAVPGAERNRLWDLYAALTDSFRVRGGGVRDTAAAWIGTAAVEVDAAGLAWDADGYWEATAVAETKWVWLAIDTDAETATLNCGAALPDLAARVQIEPLFYVPWDSGASRIDRANILDLRAAKRAYPPETGDARSVERSSDDKLQWRAFDDIDNNIYDTYNNPDQPPFGDAAFPYVPFYQDQYLESEYRKVYYVRFQDMLAEVRDATIVEIEASASWDGLNDTSGVPGVSATHGFIPVSDEMTGSLDLKDPLDLGLFWKLGGNETQCYGSDIGDSAETRVLDLDERELITAWTAASRFYAEDGIRLDETPYFLNLYPTAGIEGEIGGAFGLEVAGEFSVAHASAECELLLGAAAGNRIYNLDDFLVESGGELLLQYGAAGGVRFGQDAASAPLATALDIVVETSAGHRQIVRVLGAVTGDA